MPSFSAMLHQLSGLPVFSSTCSHKPAAVGCWLTAGAAQARALTATRMATTPGNFIDHLSSRSIHLYRRHTAAISRKDQRDAHAMQRRAWSTALALRHLVTMRRDRSPD